MTDVHSLELLIFTVQPQISTVMKPEGLVDQWQILELRGPPAISSVLKEKCRCEKPVKFLF